MINIPLFDSAQYFCLINLIKLIFTETVQRERYSIRRQISTFVTLRRFYTDLVTDVSEPTTKHELDM
jgi:hypothetical protein